MKKIILAILLVSALTAQSQVSFVVTNMTKSVSVVANEMVSLTTTANVITTWDFDIKNTSGSTQTYTVKRYDQTLNALAKAYFCFGGLCFGQGTTESGELELLNNQSASGVSGPNNILTTDLEEGPTNGYSKVKYTFFCNSIPNDSLQFTIVYNSTITSVYEGFAAFPPTNWNIVNADKGRATWIKGSGVGAFGSSNDCAKYDFFNNANVGDKDAFQLPPMDLSGIGSPTLTFDWSYAQRTSTSNDKLEFLISDNGGSSWTTMYTNQGSNMSTVTGPISTAFTPSQQDATQWKTATVILTGFNKPNVISKFVVTNNNGNNLFIDNVQLTEVVTGLRRNNKENVTLNIFPNPAQETTNLVFNSIKSTIAELSIYNSLGSKIENRNVDLTDGNNKINLKTDNLPAGIYFVNIKSSTFDITKKLIVE